MIFLPKKNERYAAILRNTMQKLIAKNGFCEKYLTGLMKIHRFEALISDDREPVNIKEYSENILGAVFLLLFEKNKDFYFKLHDTGTVLINRKRFTSLLLNLCKTAEEVEIGQYDGKILLKSVAADYDDNVKLIKAFKHTYYYEVNTKTLNILIDAEKTDKEDLHLKDGIDYVLDPLSVVNIYLDSE